MLIQKSGTCTFCDRSHILSPYVSYKETCRSQSHFFVLDFVDSAQKFCFYLCLLSLFLAIRAIGEQYLKSCA